ncbi:MAG: type II secretion system protein, partial [Burkholderiales bacterium]
MTPLISSPPLRCAGLQAGFSLVELIIAVALIGIITAAAMSSFSGSEETKTAAVISKMEEIANAVAMYKKNTGCVPNNVSVLFNKTLATAANNFCGADTTASYGNQDYMAAMPGDGGNGVMLSQLGISGADL